MGRTDHGVSFLIRLKDETLGEIQRCEAGNRFFGLFTDSLAARNLRNSLSRPLVSPSLNLSINPSEALYWNYVHPSKFVNVKKKDTLCKERQHVVNHVCQPCPNGTTKRAGDNPSGADTKCHGNNFYSLV